MTERRQVCKELEEFYLFLFLFVFAQLHNSEIIHSKFKGDMAIGCKDN